MNPNVDVTILSPDEESTFDKRLNLFLYQIVESPFLRNSDWQPRLDDPATIMAPPLSVKLYYLLTPYTTSQQELGQADAHGILGEAMRVFHEFAIVPELYLAETSLVPGQIKITPTPLSLDDLSKIWNSLKNPFRLSVAYEVSLLQIDLSAAQELPKRVERAHVLPARSDFRKPQILAISPQKGKVSAEILVSGKNLTNLKAVVKMGGQTATPADFTIVQDESFAFTVPVALGPGMYEVLINVGQIVQARFFFEVEATL
ncbi:DUF4255 domain-containing protein [bacterium]|nr:DUF4255 domain-containing protein [bacterium]